MQDEVLASANILMVSHTPGVSFAELFSALAARMPSLAWVHARSAGIEHLVCPALLSASAQGIPVPALEAIQGQMDGFFGQPLNKCHFEEVVSVGD
jgi:hypothetical protein